MGDVKNFLYAWCGKKKMTPSYEIRAVGNKNRQKFMCEVLKDAVFIYVIFFLYLRLLLVLRERCFLFRNVVSFFHIGECSLL